MEELQEDGFAKNPPISLLVSSGAANTSVLENAPVLSSHGGRETDTIELGEDGTFIIYFGNVGILKDHVSETDWSRCLWRGNKFGRLIPSIFLLGYISPLDSIYQSSIALSREVVDERSLRVENFGERVSSTFELSDHHEFEARPWRGTFCLSHPEKLIFSQDVELKMADLPRWKPLVRIDPRRLERVNE